MAPPVRTAWLRLTAPLDRVHLEALLEAVDQRVCAGARRVVLLLDGPGGEPGHALVAHHYLRGLPCEVQTHNAGTVEGAGLLLYAAGRWRTADPAARFLLAPLGGGAAEAVEPLDALLAPLLADGGHGVRLLSRATGRSEETLAAALDGYAALDAEGALELGLAEAIVEAPLPGEAHVEEVRPPGPRDEEAAAVARSLALPGAR